MNDNKTLQTETATKPLKVEKGPEVTLIAKEEKQKLSNGVIVPVWTFNGSSPSRNSSEKGEKVKVTLKMNYLHQYLFIGMDILSQITWMEFRA